MKAESSKYLLEFLLAPRGVRSIGITEPDGTPDPEIPAGFLAPNGKTTDPTILNPAPEFPAPPDGTPDISGRWP